MSDCDNSCPFGQNGNRATNGAAWIQNVNNALDVNRSAIACMRKDIEEMDKLVKQNEDVLIEIRGGVKFLKYAGSLLTAIWIALRIFEALGGA